MGRNLHARRLAPVTTLVLILGALAAPFAVRQWQRQHDDLHGTAMQRIAGALRAPLSSALPTDELASLASVAPWLQPVDTRPAAELAEQIREDAASFAVFAGFHTAQEKRQALADTPYGKLIARAADAHAVDSLLVASVVEVESTFRPTVGSHKGAVGLMQLLPDTAGLSRKRLQNPGENLDAGAAYLAKLIARFDGDLGLALAAYNAGPTNVRRYNGVPPFPETQQYVTKVLSRYVDYHRRLWLESGAAHLVAT